MTFFQLLALTLVGQPPRPVYLNGEREPSLWWDGAVVMPIRDRP